MRKFYLIFISIIVVMVIASLFVYIKYEDYIVFAPHIFLTEVFKFISLTVIWAIIVQLFNKYNNEKKKRNHVNILVLYNIKVIQTKIEKGLNPKELTLGINLILNNISTIKLLYDFSAKELNHLSTFENDLKSSDLQDSISNIEYLLENKLTYLNTEPCNNLINTLNQLNYVFGNKD
jgi:hypothetical protein